MSGSERPVVFVCAGQQLLGILHAAQGRTTGIGVLVVVGGPQYRVGSHRQFVLMARRLAAAGVAVFRFDYRGMGDSDGAPRPFDSINEDITAALRAFATAEPGLRSVVLWGLCDAASAILMYPAPASVCGKIIVNPWARTDRSQAGTAVRHYYLKRFLRRDFWRKFGSGKVRIGVAVQEFAAALRRSLARPTGADARQHSFIDRMLLGLGQYAGPTLLILSGRDLTAREFEALRESGADWAEALGAARVSVARLDDADHTFSERKQLERCAQVTLNWIGTLGAASP